MKYGGRTGFYSAYYDTTDAVKLQDPTRHYGIVRCLEQPFEPTQSLPRPAQAETYNGRFAALWALNNAQEVQPSKFDACTWFVSQALWYGGLHRTAAWHDGPVIPRIFKGTPGTSTSTAAANLVGYLRKHYNFAEVKLDIHRFDANRVPEARIGDIIAYDWNWNAKKPKANTLDHLSLVVNIAPGNYPEVAEWGTAKGEIVPYVKRGWTYSELDNTWLQSKFNDRVVALLIRVGF